MVQLPTDNDDEVRSTSFSQRNKKLIYGLGSLLLLGNLFHIGSRLLSGDGSSDLGKEQCPKSEPVIPKFNVSLDKILNDPEYKKLSIDRLSHAVQIPTEVQDINPEPLEDPEYYANFHVLHRYFQKTFPLFHEHLSLEVVNGVGLLYTWKGKNDDLKPALFMAHQDVVPVNNDTWDDWKFPPFSGHYEEETDLVWGRGSNDCKNLLVAQFEAVEQLLSDGFVPERTIIFSYGFDEESSGIHGAGTLAPFLHKRYGNDSFVIIIDEGEGITEVEKGVFVATPVNGEKGYVDIEINVIGHGGHSSVPPDHTTIGIAADLITVLENNPFEYEFELDSPLYGTLTCAAEHSKSMPKKLKRTILDAPNSKKQKKLLTEFLSSQKDLRDLIRTTQAVDIIHGGVKANALPESANFLVNHRINLHSSVKEVVERDLFYVKEIAAKHGYGVSFDGKIIVEETELGIIDLSIQKALEPAPISPSEGGVWDVLAGTIQDLFENRVFNKEDKNEIYVTTGLFSGNTDTKHYWNLTKNIYRFIGSISGSSVLKTVHSVNEHIEMKGHLSAIAFVYEFIVNINEQKVN